MSKSLHLRVSVPSPEVTAPFCLVPSPSSLKRLGILYLTTCVGLGYDLMLPDA